MNQQGQLYIGTCGYDYFPDWSGDFYPEGVARAHYLAYYATQFNALEIDHTYYRMPEAVNLASLEKRTEGKVALSIKAHESLTHKIDPTANLSFVRFKAAIEPIMKSGILKAVLFQFPYSFHYEPDQRKYLSRLLTEFKGYPCVVEFRNSDWIQEKTINGLRERNAAFGCVDLPEIDNLPQSVDIVTASFGYVRFHGRNSKQWWTGDATQRYDYRYNEDELLPWAERIKRMNSNVQYTMAFFNNHARGSAPMNAQTLKTMLE